MELAETGVAVFTWNCRDEDSCTHGPRDVTYDETDAQAYYCREQRRRGGRRDSSEEEEDEEEGVGEDQRGLAGGVEQGGEGTEGGSRRVSGRQGHRGGRGQSRGGGRGQGRRGGRGRV